jgi:hypothetical protein
MVAGAVEVMAVEVAVRAAEVVVAVGAEAIRRP